MWRRVDLHFHTTPNERSDEPFDAEATIRSAADDGLDVLVVADHDSVDHVEPLELVSASAGALSVLPGVEISTDRGHVLAIAGSGQLGLLRDFMLRTGVQPATIRPFDDVVGVATSETAPGGQRYRDGIVLIASHADQPGSLLQPSQALPVGQQLEAVSRLDAVEIVNEGTRTQYIKSGIKNEGLRMPVLVASDMHRSTDQRFSNLLYLEDLSAQALRHAFGVPESCIRADAAPSPPRFVIDSLEFDGGIHAGRVFEFHPRTNGLIGPPASGKSVVIDSLRFVFGLESDIEEIRATSTSRLDRALHRGTTVRVRGHADGTPYTLERTWGGAQPVSPPFKPVVFGQTELVRRGMEQQPSLALIDVHCPGSSSLKDRTDELRAGIEQHLRETAAMAAESRSLAGEVANREDGLEATRLKIRELAGSEALARRATAVARVKAWRARVEEEASSWLEEETSIEELELPQPPNVSADLPEAEQYLPIAELESVLEEFRGQESTLADQARLRLQEVMNHRAEEIAALESQIASELETAGFAEGSSLLDQLNALRARLDSLEETAERLRALDGEIDDGLSTVSRMVAEGFEVRSQLRAERREACSRVNDSMPSFFCKVELDADPSDVDGLLEEAKTGTYQRRPTLADVRDNLDRDRLLVSAVRRAQGRESSLPASRPHAAQDEISYAAVGRSGYTTLAHLAVAYPADGLSIANRANPDETFSQMTEGMRALAIKEISFAASEMPVITDQPEDAVPPQNVYANLVPTVRKQRISRQFILASHDANMVVASDLEKITVLGRDDPPGTLFDSHIKDAAIELLEGGLEAFEVRGKRYRRT